MIKYQGVTIEHIPPGTSGLDMKYAKNPLGWARAFQILHNQFPSKKVMMNKFPDMDYDQYLEDRKPIIKEIQKKWRNRIWEKKPGKRK